MSTDIDRVLEKYCPSMNILFLDDNGRAFRRRIFEAMEEYANIKAREAAEKALEVAATMNHNSTPVSDGFIEHYLKSNYPITKNTEG